MNQILDLKKKRLVGGREFIVVIASIILATIGIRAGDQWFFSDQEKSACPEDMAFVTSELGGFCIDKYEVSAAADCPFPVPTAMSQSAQNINDQDCRPVSVQGAIPWRGVSQSQASEACAKAGKRLPTNREWQQAAFGTPDHDSPWDQEDCQVDKNWDFQPGQTGSGANCLSSAGAFDMVGNVWEWVDGAVNDGSYNGRPLPEEGYIKGMASDAMPTMTEQASGDELYNKDYLWIQESGVRGIARGGYWNNKSDAGKNALYLSVSPSDSADGIGFRCVK